MIRRVREFALRGAALCLALSGPGAAAAEIGAAVPPPAQGPPPMVGAPPPAPYAICIDYCTRDEEALSFPRCHELCKELVLGPPPVAAGGESR